MTFRGAGKPYENKRLNQKKRRVVAVFLLASLPGGRAQVQCKQFVQHAGDAQLNIAFWSPHCLKIPDDAAHIEFTVAANTDVFKPKDGYTWCQMLTSRNKHLWWDGMTWRTPTYHDDAGAATVLGGSKQNWPLNNVFGDNRQYLNFWGSADGVNGACDGTTGASWSQAIVGRYCLPLTSLTTNVTTSTNVTSTTRTISTTDHPKQPADEDDDGKHEHREKKSGGGGNSTTSTIGSAMVSTAMPATTGTLAALAALAAA